VGHDQGEGVTRTGSDLCSQFETFRASQDYDGLVSLFSRDAVYVEPAGRHQGREAILAWFNDWRPALSELRIEALLVIEQGGVVVAEWRGRATHSGPITMGDGTVVPATGKTMDTPTVTILEVVDGQVVAAREYYDQLTGIVQLGLMPGP
jgi:steroid delta-isomerase-like uncharacterized protein